MHPSIATQELRRPNEDRRKVLFVSDNRDNPNWGGRSTAMALLELLAASDLVPTDSIGDLDSRAEMALTALAALEPLLRNPLLGRLAASGLARGGRTRWTLEHVFGIHDYVGDDPEATVRRWRNSRLEPIQDLVRRVERADAVVVNGEGSMIFTTPSRLEQRFNLAVLKLAQSAGIPTAYVNALVADPAHGVRNGDTFSAFREVLSGTLVTVRDPESLEVVRSMAPETDAVYVPDALFTWKGRFERGAPILAETDYIVPFHRYPDKLGRWDFTRPYVCVGGSSEAAKEPQRALESYRRLLVGVMGLGYQVVVVESSSGDSFLQELAAEASLPLIPAETNVMVAGQILANAELVVTGRYHPAILAGLTGVPCVLLGADSHKTKSVQRMLGYPVVEVFSEQPTDADVSNIVRKARQVLEERPSWSEAILEAAECRAAEAARLTDHLASLRRPAE